MGIVGTNNLTLVEQAKRLDPDGSMAVVAELLSQTNQMIVDVPFVEGNLDTGHRYVQRTGLPDISWRRANRGVTPTKSETAQIDETSGRMEALSVVDELVAEAGGMDRVAATRLGEAQAHIEAMGQEFATKLIYGNQSTDPDEITGLAPRYNSVAQQNVIDGGGTGSDNTSIWLITWAPNKVYGFYPKGMAAGLQRRDYGKDLIQDSTGVAGAQLAAYREQFKWDVGLALQDWRYVVRLANIDVSDLVGGTGITVINNMVKMIHTNQNPAAGRSVFYMNRTVMAALDDQALDKANLRLQVGEEEGKMKTMLRGIPIHLTDALVNTEAQVV